MDRYENMPTFDFSKSIFYGKNHPNISDFFSLKDKNLGAHFLLLTFHDKINFLYHLIFLNDDQFSTARHYSNSQNSIIFFGHVDF